MSDLDDFAELRPIEQFLVVLDQVQDAYGLIDIDAVSTARVYMLYWALVRRRKLESHAFHRSTHRRSDKSGTRELRQQAFSSPEAMQAYWAAAHRK